MSTKSLRDGTSVEGSSGVATASADLKGCAHTPGPWTVVLGQDALVKCPDGRSFNVGDAIYHRDNVANARLIAAAPELLAALKALSEACMRADSIEELSAEIDGSLLDAAHAAIDKAEQG